MTSPSPEDLDLARRLVASGQLDGARARSALAEVAAARARGSPLTFAQLLASAGATTLVPGSSPGALAGTRTDTPASSRASALETAPTVTPGSSVSNTLARSGEAATRGPVVGQRFARYDVLELLGRGGMGAVYRARDAQLGRNVALKVLLTLDDPRLRERFAREARAVAVLRHPGIVALLDAGEVAGAPYLALELVEGETLSHAIRRGLEGREAARLAAEIARAVAHAHDAGILHRDLKPSNVLLERDGRARVSDFGLARAAGEAASGLSASGQILGSPGYMSPEQAAGETATKLSDVYGLGAILYEMLVGRAPHEGATPANVIFSVIQKDPPRPRSLRPKLHADLETICLRGLEKDPARRYPGANALADDLERFLAGEAIVARPEGVLRRLAKRARAHKLALAVFGGALVAGAAALVSVPYAADRRARDLDDAERTRVARRAELLAPATDERDPARLVALASTEIDRTPPSEELAVLGMSADERRAFFLERRLAASLRSGEAAKARDEALHKQAYARAARDAEALSTLAPARQGRWCFVRALGAFENGDVAGARAFLGKAKSADPEGGFGQASELALREMDGKRSADFRTIALRCVAREPDSPELAIFCATVLVAGDMASEARSVLAGLVKRDPRPRCELAERRLEALSALADGKLLLSQRNLAAAEVPLERAVRADASFDFAFVDLTNCYHGQGKLRELLDAAERGLARRAPRLEMLGARGVAKLGLGDAKAAVKDFEEASQVRPDPPTLRWLGEALAAEGKNDEALAAVRRSLELDPTLLPALLLEAALLGRTGEKTKALEILDGLLGEKSRPLGEAEKLQVARVRELVEKGSNR